jgi:hypothetical protein
MENILGQIEKGSFLIGVLLFALGFAAAFLAWYLWQQFQANQPNLANGVGTIAAVTV